MIITQKISKNLVYFKGFKGTEMLTYNVADLGSRWILLSTIIAHLICVFVFACT